MKRPPIDYKGFPLGDYLGVQDEARQLVIDRCDKGRNLTTAFYDQATVSDMEVQRSLWLLRIRLRQHRIEGAILTGNWMTLRADALDMVNYAAFLVLVLDRLQVKVKSAAAQPQDPEADSQP